MAQTSVFKKGMRLMGNHFEISVIAQNEAWAFEKIELAVQEIKKYKKGQRVM